MSDGTNDDFDGGGDGSDSGDGGGCHDCIFAWDDKIMIYCSHGHYISY